MKQADGGCIGVDMTVEMAAIYMLIWDLSFLMKLKKIGVKYSLYKRYVDDIVIVLRAIDQGWYFDIGTSKFIFNPDQEYSRMEADLRTFVILRDIANQLDSDIQLTVDVPSLHPSRKLPVLDLQISTVQNSIRFEFFKKPILDPRVILYNSAISSRTKRDTLLQEGCRQYRTLE